MSTKEILINKQKKEAIPLGKNARAASLIRKQNKARQCTARNSWSRGKGGFDIFQSDRLLMEKGDEFINDGVS